MQQQARTLFVAFRKLDSLQPQKSGLQSKRQQSAFARTLYCARYLYVLLMTKKLLAQRPPMFHIRVFGRWVCSTARHPAAYSAYRKERLTTAYDEVERPLFTGETKLFIHQELVTQFSPVLTL